MKIVEAAIDEGTACCVRVSNYRQIVNAVFKLAVIRYPVTIAIATTDWTLVSSALLPTQLLS
ncbi:hypothetical protein [Microcoleus sp. herbarium2]|uniref:hypothetical protein n=1 Tax=Microcoleus sp. herbarium2 TaxID=3055433 RepID=UPI002FD6C78D